MKKRFRSVRLRDLSAFSKSCLRYCISYGLLRASHSRNPTGIRISRVRASSSYLLPSKAHPTSYARFACDESFCVFEELFKVLYKLRIASCFALLQSYKYSHFRAAYASLRAHTCCLRNRIRPLTRASRATSPSAFSKSLYSKKLAPDT